MAPQQTWIHFFFLLVLLLLLLLLIITLQPLFVQLPVSQAHLR